MLHYENIDVRAHLLKGGFGLEKENLRITPEGKLAQTENPFPDHPNIVRDFCESQTEINTSVWPSAEEAVKQLFELTGTIQKRLSIMPNPELLWPFSNPPYIKNEADIPVARFYGDQAEKTNYREYLSDRYGRYKMVLCGIHVNFSFAEELLQADFALSEYDDYTEYKNQLYLKLGQGLAAYGWILTTLTAASPLLDRSYFEKGLMGGYEFNGMASVRCSALGYWNHFAPIFQYSDIQSYADSIQRYVDEGLIAAPSELYYPIRLKPKGVNDLDRLRNDGVNHIELRMFDLNPLHPAGVDERDIEFAHLLMIYLASVDFQPLTPKDQVQAVQNYKSSAHYDLKTVKVVLPDGAVGTVVDEGVHLIRRMKSFFQDFPQPVLQILDFEELKLMNPELRYAWRIREQYAEEFVEKGLSTARLCQERMVHV